MTLVNPLGPTRSDERIAALDIARGMALFGIFMVNIQIMTQPLISMFDGAGATQGPLAAAVHFRGCAVIGIDILPQ